MKRKSGRPIRSLPFLPTGLGIAVALLVAALAFLSPQGIGKAEAYSVTNDGRIMVNGSRVHVSLVWYEAELDDVFGMDSPVSQDLFTCKTQPAGVPIDLGVFDAGELVFRLKTPEGNTWYTGPASRNADNFQHAQLEVMSDTVVRIHWEDYYGGGDQDFNDCNVEVTIEDLPTPTSTFTPLPTATSTPTPMPTSIPTSTVVPPSRCPGDVNHDGRVDWRDAFIVMNAMFSRPGQPRWNPAADLNGDKRIDWSDLEIVFRSLLNPRCWCQH
ncbi:MAG: dockerin type I domain-containing protein [Dehalococcoidia bacterium]|jgi:hypothetical protein